MPSYQDMVTPHVSNWHILNIGLQSYSTAECTTDTKFTPIKELPAFTHVTKVDKSMSVETWSGLSFMDRVTVL